MQLLPLREKEFLVPASFCSNNEGELPVSFQTILLITLPSKSYCIDTINQSWLIVEFGGVRERGKGVKNHSEVCILSS